MKNIKIANGQGFWGDSVQAPIDLIKYSDIDYLTLDYLAEVTLSIMQKQKNKNSKYGYAKDFLDLITHSCKLIKRNKIKIITNAGGVNPISCAEAIKNNLKSDKIKIGIIEGDDITNKLDDLLDKGANLSNMDTNENISKIKDKICSANVYINSYTVKEALDLGANIVLAGRVSDPGLTLGPLLHEFGWSNIEYNKIASGTLAGHIIECGAQCTGGNFTKWYDVKQLENIGYPIVEVSNNGDFTVSKPEKSGGIINKYTVSEQILYEMGDPRNYISPDVVVDFTSFKLKDNKNNSVNIKGVIGYKPTDTYKVSISYLAGYKSSGQLTISGPNSYLKARKTADIIWSRLRRSGYSYEKKNTEFIGFSDFDNHNDITLRLSVFDTDRNKVSRFGKEISPVITSGVPGITGFSGGRPKAQEVIAYWPTLIDKKFINTKVSII